MVGLLFAFFCGMMLLTALWLSGQTRRGVLFPGIVMGGYGLRLLLNTFVRELPLFSHGPGGMDSEAYELQAQVVALLWRYQGFRYYSDILGETSLPAHIFAIPTFLNGGTSRLALVSIVALAAGLAVVNLAALAIELGAVPRQVHMIMSIFYFDLAFLFYTSDSYKDGLVVCLTVGILGASIRLRNRWSPTQILIGAVSVSLLWFTRFYLVFLAIAPLVVGIAGVGSRARGRLLFGAVLVCVTLILVGAYTNVLQSGSENAAVTFQRGTSSASFEMNSRGGSGVDVGVGGSPLASLGVKLAYALFSPFLWTGGSLGLQIAKIEALFWYFLIYRGVRAAKTLETHLLIMLLTFLVPCALMYAMSVFNIGLIVRQRLVIVAGATLLASFYRPAVRPRANALGRPGSSRPPGLSRPPGGLSRPGLSRPPGAEWGARRSMLPRA